MFFSGIIFVTIYNICYVQLCIDKCFEQNECSKECKFCRPRFYELILLHCFLKNRKIKFPMVYFSLYKEQNPCEIYTKCI